MADEGIGITPTSTGLVITGPADFCVDVKADRQWTWRFPHHRVTVLVVLEEQPREWVVLDSPE